MKRLLLALVILAGLAAPAFSATRTALHLVSRAPLEVRGAGFRPHERVIVRAATFQVRVRSSSLGRFTAKFPFGDRCSGGRVVAAGRHGQSAVLYVPPVLCPVTQPQRAS